VLDFYGATLVYFKDTKVVRFLKFGIHKFTGSARAIDPEKRGLELT
jgi:hypothetical protein